MSAMKLLSIMLLAVAGSVAYANGWASFGREHPQVSAPPFDLHRTADEIYQDDNGTEWIYGLRWNDEKSYVVIPKRVFRDDGAPWCFHDTRPVRDAKNLLRQGHAKVYIVETER